MNRHLGRRAALLSTAALAGGIAVSRFAVRHHLSLPHAVEGERREMDGRAGRVSYYKSGAGAPVVLVHSINAAGSVYEVKPIFEHFATRRTVYALDLPGFGFSDRSDRRYDIRLYTDAIHDMLDVVARDHRGEGIDLLALSLASEFAARAVVERPERVRSLAMITPTGFERGAERRRGPAQSDREVPGVYRAVAFPLWSQALFDALVSKPSIRFFLQKTFGDKRIDEGMLEYDYLSTHRPGARFAPLAFLSGRLFAKDVRNVYEALRLPVWLAHGTRGDFADFSSADWTRQRGNWTQEAFPTGALPHFQTPERFLASYERFLASDSGALRAAG